MRAEVLRHIGRWDQARHVAERLRAKEALPGTYQLVMIDSRTGGLEAAEPRWRELARLLETDEADEGTRLSGRCIVAWALANWTDADRGLDEFLATDPDWDVLADLADVLTELLQSPDADRTRIGSYLSAVTEARDAVQACYAE